MIAKKTPTSNGNCPPVALVVAGLHSPSRRAILIDVLFTPVVTNAHVPTAGNATLVNVLLAAATTERYVPHTNTTVIPPSRSAWTTLCVLN